MKKITSKILCVSLALFTFSVASMFAEEVKLKKGKATVSAKVEANGKVTYSISAKKFRMLTIKQKSGETVKYELKRGNEFLSSGHTTGSNVIKKIKSDGKSSYSITITNEAKVAKKLELSFYDEVEIH